MADYDAFFRGYAEVYTRSLSGPVETEPIRSHFAGSFVGSGPGGVAAGQNDDSFSTALHEGFAFYRSIGTQRMMAAYRENGLLPPDRAAG